VEARDFFIAARAEDSPCNWVRSAIKQGSGLPVLSVAKIRYLFIGRTTSLASNYASDFPEEHVSTGIVDTSHELLWSATKGTIVPGSFAVVRHSK
jgi:hypothetical protein